jgi:hypothetical protein
MDFETNLHTFLSQMLKIDASWIQGLTMSSGSIAIQFNLADSSNSSDGTQNEISRNLMALVDVHVAFEHDGQSYTSIINSVRIENTSVTTTTTTASVPVCLID